MFPLFLSLPTRTQMADQTQLSPDTSDTTSLSALTKQTAKKMLSQPP